MTIEPCRKLRNYFTNLSAFYIIDIDSILNESGLDVTKPSHQYLINTEIERLITSGAKSKRYMGLIYINSRITCDTITSIKASVENLPNSSIESFVALDEYEIPKMKDYYQLFDEVIFFPALKRTRIIECTPIPIPKETESE